MKIFSVVGARPQFIKAAPLSKALRLNHEEFLVHTGQHYDAGMSDLFFQQLGIPRPDVNLGIGSGSHAVQTASMLLTLELLMKQQSPDWVLVYGDTNSTLAAALAASKLHIPIAHVEAGLRSFNQAMPEEINRVLTDHVSSLLLCPTQVAVDNLEREGIKSGVVVTGDIMVDAVLQNVDRARKESDVHKRFGLSSGDPYIVVTIHRPSNTDQRETMAQIFAALNASPLPVIFPVHPRTQGMIETYGLSPDDHVHLISPVGYLDMLALLDSASVLLTDSGGLQKEAYILQTPCVTVRTETEWVETVESGWNRLTAAEQKPILAAINTASNTRPSQHPDYYGDGSAAVRIVAALEKGG